MVIRMISEVVREKIWEVSDLINYIRKRSEIEQEIIDLDRDLDVYKALASNLKAELNELRDVEKKKDDYLETVRRLRKEVKELKNKNQFLMKRDNKLQELEQLCKDGRVGIKTIKSKLMEE